MTFFDLTSLAKSRASVWLIWRVSDSIIESRTSLRYWSSDGLKSSIHFWVNFDVSSERSALLQRTKYEYLYLKQINMIWCTVECQNPNVRISDSTEIWTKWSPIPKRSDFGQFVRSFGLSFQVHLCIESNKNCSVWTIRSDFRHKFSAEIQRKTFGFQTFWCSNHYCYQTKVVCRTSSDFSIPLYSKCLKSKIVRYSNTWGSRLG